MGCPRVRYGWSCLGFLGGTFFALSLVGLGAACALAVWAYLLQLWIGEHVNVARPGEGYLWPATLGLAVLLLAPVHGLGLRLRGDLVKDLASWSALRKRAPARGKTVDRLLFLHALLSCLSGFLLFGACTGGAYLWGQSRRRVRWGLHRALQRYSSDEHLRARVDRLQIELRCCGSESYVDWLLVPWSRGLGYDDDEMEEQEEDEEMEMNESIERRDTGGGGGGRSQDVPFSCCLADIPQVYCVHRGVIRHRSREEQSLRFAATGCADRLVARTDDAGRDVVACLVLLSVYQLTLSVLSRLLQTTRRSAASARPTDGKRLFDGWLFGRGPPARPPRRRQQCTAAGSFLRPSAKVALSDDCAARSMVRGDGPCSSSSGSDASTTSGVGETPADAAKRGAREIEASQDEHNEEEEEECEGDDEGLQLPPAAAAAPRIFNSTDFYGRFRGTLQETLERRRNRVRGTGASFPSLAPERRQLVDNQASSSSTLPSLPATPRRHPRPSVSSCPVHNRCPVHQFGDERTGGRCPVHDLR